MMKNAKFLEYHFYLNTNIYGDFQICISVPLSKVNLDTWESILDDLSRVRKK